MNQGVLVFQEDQSDEFFLGERSRRSRVPILRSFVTTCWRRSLMPSVGFQSLRALTDGQR